MGRVSADLRLAGHVTGPDTYSFQTADGVCRPEEFRDAELLAAGALRDTDAIGEDDSADALVVDANYGVIGVLTAPVARVTMTTASARAGRLCRTNAARNNCRANVAVTADPTQLPHRFDVAAYAPKPDTPIVMGTCRLLAALERLRPDGTLFVACRDRDGGARYESQLADAGANPVEIDRRGDCRLLCAERPATVEPEEAVEPSRRTVTVGRREITLTTLPGTFAAPGLDDGTRALLDRLSLDGGRVLDLCCGAGPITAWAAPEADAVVATDDDPVAVACARETLAASGVSARVRLGDGTRGLAGNAFDRVICNPPTHAGYDLLRELFVGAKRVLEPGGVCSLVHHRSLAFDDLLTPFDEERESETTAVYRIRHLRVGDA